MRFRLIYDGPLSSKRQGIADDKHKIRRCFHGQLQKLWETNKFLSTHTVSRKQFGNPPRPISDDAAYWGGPDDREPLRDVVADCYQEHGYRFLPLVREDWQLLCDLEVLFLRRDVPGGVVNAGDIDNRIKTLIDALRKPNHAQELGSFTTPQDGENPFFCLLEDDKLISKLTVESDNLLDPTSLNKLDNSRVRLVITATVKPYYATTFNLSFA